MGIPTALCGAYLRRSGVGVQELLGRDETEALYLARCAVERGTGALVSCGGDGIVNLALVFPMDLVGEFDFLLNVTRQGYVTPSSAVPPG